MSEQVIRAADIAEYDFGNVAPPEGFDPEAHGFVSIPVGYHIVEIADFSMVQGKDFKDGDTTVYLNQLRPQLRVPEGLPYAGATTMDFLAMPTPGQQMPKTHADNWACFLRALGMPATKTALVPPGFKLHDIIGKRCKVQVVPALDRDNKPRIGQDGVPQSKVRFFGYHPMSADLPLATSPGTGKASTPAKDHPAVRTADAAPATEKPPSADAIHFEL